MGRAKKEGDKTLALVYLRVSTEDQHLGPKAQAKAVETWAKANGVRTFAYFIDHGVSGGADIDKRPALLDALNALETTGAGVLLVAKRDRLARDIVNAALIERMAQRSGARVQSADGIGDGDSAEAFLQRAIMDAFAQYERLLIGARTKAALAVKKARGEATGGDAPFGYRKVNGKLQPIKREQKVLSFARKLRDEGLSLRKVAERLKKCGYKPRDGQTFHPQQIARMLAA